MPDISMCPGKDMQGNECPKRKSCYRYTASPVLQDQSWIMPPDGIEGMEHCKFYWAESINNHIKKTTYSKKVKI